MSVVFFLTGHKVRDGVGIEVKADQTGEEVAKIFLRYPEIKTT